MNKVFKAAVLAIATLATVAPMMATSAQADDWRRRHHRDRGDAIALGALGLATGVIVGGAIASSQPRYQEREYIDPEPEYYEPRQVYRPQPVYRPRPVYVERPVYAPRPVVQSYGVEPWSPAWYNYCQQRYRSFNPRSGTFVGYDGRQYFCNAG